MSKRISKGGNFALDAFYQVYDSPKSLLFSFMATLVGLPIVVWAVNWIAANYHKMTFLSREHVDVIANFYANVHWTYRLGGIGIVALLFAPLIVFFYTGVVRFAIDIKKKHSFKNSMMSGLSGLGVLSLWVFALFISGSMMKVLALPWNVMFTKAYAFETTICMLVCLYMCFAFITLLVKKTGFIGALRKGCSIICSYLPEIVSGIIVWCAMAFVGFLVVHTISIFVLEYVMKMPNQFFASTALVMSLFPGVWVLISATAWVLFVYDICRTSKIK